MSSTTARQGDAVTVFSVFLIVQSKTGNIVYLISLLTKNKLRTATFWIRHFVQASKFLTCLLFGKN